MTETNYVNRVDQTRLQKIDGSKLAESVDEELYPRRDRKIGTDPVPVAPLVPTSIYPSLWASANQDPPKAGDTITTDLDWVNSTEPDELPDDGIGNVAPTPAPEPPFALYFGPSREEFETFKKQVVAALRHIGVDVRKYFEV
jgi:hypothetical protein